VSKRLIKPGFFTCNIIIDRLERFKKLVLHYCPFAGYDRRVEIPLEELLSKKIEKTYDKYEFISLLIMDSLKIDIEKGKKVATILFESFNSDEGIFGHNVMPEDLLWGSDLSGIKVEKGSYDHLMFITMVVSIDYMRDADKLWQAGRETMEDSETKWLFSPEMVKNKPIEEIIPAMKKHKLSQKHNRDAGIWKRISVSFVDIYDSDPRKLLGEYDYDAIKIFEKKYDIRFKRDFPSLSGNKIFPLWLRMLHDNVGIELVNLDKIPIPVDVHIARATFATGCLHGAYTGTIEKASQKIDETWKNIIEQVQHQKLNYALQMDECLWHLSKYGCRFRKDEFCPKKRECPVGEFCVRGLVHVSAKGIKISTG